jgi:heme/copper-type cytochrome/quinol oxidase subunit 3|tara:strand:- start:5163 stop:6032 length:870 start_codon:yes stop_codon:yes gene_type:complete
MIKANKKNILKNYRYHNDDIKIHKSWMFKKRTVHGFHLVDPSNWPTITALSACCLVIGFINWFHGLTSSILYSGLIALIICVYLWWRDTLREGFNFGFHTTQVFKGLQLGFLLFIVSEVMFFFAFFWALFHSSFNPSHFIGAIWPAANITIVSPWDIPLINTIILLTSGATITWCHNYLCTSVKNESVISLAITIGLAIFFLILQGYEYTSGPFNISDSAYGSVFFLLTGFHGFHVFIGTCFLTICLIRFYFKNFTQNRHFGFEAAAWYWHFVDVVWLFLFIVLYCWSL